VYYGARRIHERNNVRDTEKKISRKIYLEKLDAMDLSVDRILKKKNYSVT